jgi:hypothetical protein
MPQQQVEGGLAFLVERHNFTVDSSLYWQFQQRVPHTCKPVREILVYATPQMGVSANEAV